MLSTSLFELKFPSVELELELDSGLFSNFEFDSILDSGFILESRSEFEFELLFEFILESESELVFDVIVSFGRVERIAEWHQ